ncbi:hypothetical protein [Campylobacter sputorum]|uniref:hypothetical protein n=1 Tax=Campylobacter sputorum TaxID=206 RepID=UPI000B7793FD|nr:hypothetical protein [Campylobacter sputorum]ASM36682.1 hypothetical protein CSF_0805 [Campylobacter sputorum bv. faecalis CCUG 20703]
MKRLALTILLIVNFAFGEIIAGVPNNDCPSALLGCEPSNDYQMPGGKGSLDRILGRDPKTGKVAPPRDVSMEEAQMIGAKNTYKEAVKKSEIAKNKLEKAKKSGKGVDKAQEEYDDAIRDVELSKAKIKDLEELAKESKKEK